jgi:hypothetical protein
MKIYKCHNPNPIEIKDNIVTIFVKNFKIFLDKDIYEQYKKHKFSVNQKSGYVSITENSKSLFVKHIILPMKKDCVVLPKDGNHQNLCRSNLYYKLKHKNKYYFYYNLITKKIEVKIFFENKSKFGLIDFKDFKLVRNYRWNIIEGKTIDYIITNIKLENGKQNHKGLHRFLLPDREGLMIDHKNRNGLDNRRNNIRYCTKSQNSMNSKKILGTSSEYKGVSWCSGKNRWKVTIKLHGKRIKGEKHFRDEIEAAKYYDCIAKEIFGEFSRTNF